MGKSAIVLCSGGLDSVTTAYYVKKKRSYRDIKIIFFDYGQRNLSQERRCAKSCAYDINADFIQIRIRELKKISASLLHSKNKAQEISRRELKDTSKESIKWYVPCRNLLFLSYALAYADFLSTKNNIRADIFVGFKNEGKESYPDTTADFVKAMNKLSSLLLAQGAGKITAPLINKDKEDIVRLALKLGVDFKKTFSCYTGKFKHCGKCLACTLRKEGFYWAGVQDPTNYRMDS